MRNDDLQAKNVICTWTHGTFLKSREFLKLKKQQQQQPFINQNLLALNQFTCSNTDVNINANVIQYNYSTLMNMAPLHKTCVWTQIRKIKRKSLMRDSDWLKIKLHLIFLSCIQTQILCNRAQIFYYLEHLHYLFLKNLSGSCCGSIICCSYLEEWVKYG